MLFIGKQKQGGFFDSLYLPQGIYFPVFIKERLFSFACCYATLWYNKKKVKKCF